MFAKEQIKISRLLTAHLEAFGAARVGRSGVKFDRLQKTTSGQPIFSVDEETAEEIRATFILDLALLRSYGRGPNGLGDSQKRLLLDLAIWKIAQLVKRPFRYRTQCFLKCESVSVSTEDGLLSSQSAAIDEPTEQEAEATERDSELKASQQVAEDLFDSLDLNASIRSCNFATAQTDVYYPANELFKPGKETEAVLDGDDEEEDNG
jgi:hypothetical protein